MQDLEFTVEEIAFTFCKRAMESAPVTLPSARRRHGRRKLISKDAVRRIPADHSLICSHRL
jgi:hypothetical protein